MRLSPGVGFALGRFSGGVSDLNEVLVEVGASLPGSWGCRSSRGACSRCPPGLGLWRQAGGHPGGGLSWSLSFFSQNFPFCIISLNITRLVLQALREDRLSR